MTSGSAGQDQHAFRNSVKQPHRRVDPCFMTGKGCVYTDAIQAEITRRKTGCVGFMVVPYRPNMNVFHKLTLARYVQDSYSSEGDTVELVRADQIGRTGYVICNKICKKIQESDFVVADISLRNPNVFYELGLAYGLRQKIVVIHHERSAFGKETAEYLHCKAYTYKDLAPIQPTDFPLSQYVWAANHTEAPRQAPEILVMHLEEDQGRSPEDDISLDFATHVCAAVGVSIFEIEKKLKEDEIPLDTYREQITKLRTARIVGKGGSFQDVAAHIISSFCTIIRTGGKKTKSVNVDLENDAGDSPRPNPMTFFWLGFCHAIGRNVIPVGVLDREGEDLEDLAFDIRALWHMTFYRSQAERFAPLLQDTLHQMIVTDFSEWSRKRFWDQVLVKPEEVSIFTGALHIEQFAREMVGDWDLRSVSELTSYLASHQCRARIESPVYQVRPEFLTPQTRDSFIDELINLLRNKNCILIASPDVNPLTEIVLGEVYGIPRQEWFTNSRAADRTPNAVVAFKKKKKPTGTNKDSANIEFAFYRDSYARDDPEVAQRGFRSQILTGGEVMANFVSQTETENMQEFHVYGHLLIAPNPFRDKEAGLKYIIVLNGISGPATFALTQVLTGGVSTEFVSFNAFKPKSEAEAAVQKITEDLALVVRGDFAAVQYIYDVTVGQADPNLASGLGPTAHKTYDWRRVIRWDRIDANDGAFQLTTRAKAKAT